MKSIRVFLPFMNAIQKVISNQALVEKLLRDINVLKSCGHDMISPRLLKESAAVIAGPIANIINLCRSM